MQKSVNSSILSEKQEAELIYNMILSRAGNDEQKKIVEGYLKGRGLKTMLGSLYDGLQYGNWPWVKF